MQARCRPNLPGVAGPRLHGWSTWIGETSRTTAVGSLAVKCSLRCVVVGELLEALGILVLGLGFLALASVAWIYAPRFMDSIYRANRAGSVASTGSLALVCAHSSALACLLAPSRRPWRYCGDHLCRACWLSCS